mmetsp:Transcript_19770/g.29178  ORF Transcript_19770/g.29178 Transcript_19770/m.29178 type:complete len:114 (-) Transcript_19770:545-886(-)
MTAQTRRRLEKKRSAPIKRPMCKFPDMEAMSTEWFEVEAGEEVQMTFHATSTAFLHVLMGVTFLPTTTPNSVSSSATVLPSSLSSLVALLALWLEEAEPLIMVNPIKEKQGPM